MPLPQVALGKGTMHYFGDESFQPVASFGTLYVYALVAVHSAEKLALLHAVNSLKRALRPSVDPNSWTFHCVDLRSFDIRKKKYEIEIETARANELLRSLASTIGQIGKGGRVFFWNVSAKLPTTVWR